MKRTKLVKIISIIILITALASYLIAVYTVIRMGLIPTSYLVLAVGGSAIIMLLLVVSFRWCKSTVRRMLLSLVLLTIIGVSAYVYIAGNATSSLIQNISGSEAQDVDTTQPFILYISGIDSTEDPAARARSDVNILAVVDPRDHEILLVNTPRDYYVPLADIGAKDKLTHAGLYGVETSMATLGELYDTPVEYYLRINFSSLVQTIDVLGGIEVVSDNDFSAGGYNFQSGVNHLDGQAALVFSRERYSFVGGDRARGQNQQRVIEGIIRKLTSPGVLTNYQSTLSSLEGSLLTNMSSRSVQQLINNQLSESPDWHVNSISVTGTDSQSTTYSMGDQLLYVMEPDMASVEAAKQSIADSINH